MQNFYIPETFQMIRSFLLYSSIEYIELIPTHTPIQNTDSLIGRNGYVPAESQIPRDVFGRKMQLLAQINFTHSDTPNPFPLKGLLQFYVSNTCVETKQHYQGVLDQNDFAVIYIENPNGNYKNTNRPQINAISKYPIQQTLQLNFKHAIEPVSKFDYRFEDYIPKKEIEKLPIFKELNVDDLYLQHYSGAQHKIGGYAYFIQDDFRRHSHELQRYNTLLFQIISNDAQGIMWGDSGVIKYFINDEDLKNLSFHNTMMYVEDFT